MFKNSLPSDKPAERSESIHFWTEVSVVLEFDVVKSQSISERMILLPRFAVLGKRK